MQFFERLGGIIAKQWRAAHFDNRCFPEIALDALASMPPSAHTDAATIVHDMMAGERVPRQDLEREPPFTLFHHPRFKIGAFFWLHDEHTPIHQHCVSGALHVLDGRTLHSLYGFDVEERINARLLLGHLFLKSVECLVPGDSRPILHGNQTIHATAHLDRPTVTIVVQTHLDQETLPQYSYLPPTVAIDATARDPLLTRQLELLETLHAVGDPACLAHFEARVSSPDFEEVFLTLQLAHRLLDPDGFARVLGRARSLHGRKADALVPVFRESRRTDSLLASSHLSSNSEHNLLLSLLLQVPDRDAIFEFVTRHFGGDPVERVVQWMREMTLAAPGTEGGANVLGIHLDELSLDVLTWLLRGCSVAAIKQHLERDYDRAAIDAQDQGLRDLCEAFAGSPILQPLFTRRHAAMPVQAAG